jgi:hypothetical protein
MLCQSQTLGTMYQRWLASGGVQAASTGWASPSIRIGCSSPLGSKRVGGPPEPQTSGSGVRRWPFSGDISWGPALHK